MTIQVNMHEAKSQFSKLTEMVLRGERVVIARAGKPLVDLVPHKESKGRRVPGRYAGQIKIAEDFSATPGEVIDAFEGE